MERITADSIKMPVSAAKWIRTLTVPPVMAVILSTVLYIALGTKAFASWVHYFEAVFTLGILPTLAYPLCRLIPVFKKKGRKFERNLAIIFAVAGYISGTLLICLTGGTQISIMLFFTYLISGLITALLSFVFKFKASGHTCGVSGPIAVIVYCFGPVYLLLYVLLVPIFVSSLKLERHTLTQLIAGCLVPIAALAASIIISAAIV